MYEEDRDNREHDSEAGYNDRTDEHHDPPQGHCGVRRFHDFKGSRSLCFKGGKEFQISGLRKRSGRHHRYR